MDIRRTGQVIAAPAESVHRDGEYLGDSPGKGNRTSAEWDDAFKGVTHEKDQEFNPDEISKVGAFNSYVKTNDRVPIQLEALRGYSGETGHPIRCKTNTHRSEATREALTIVGLSVWMGRAHTDE